MDAIFCCTVVRFCWILVREVCACVTALDDGDQCFDDEEQYASALGQYIPDTKVVDHIVRHEAQHASVAVALGLSIVRFGLGADSEANLCEVFTHVSGGTIPKLAYAAIFAAPFEPSSGDKSDLQALGYEGVDEVGSRVRKWNKNKKGIFIPVPMSLTEDN
jgi:hypothetical protein